MHRFILTLLAILTLSVGVTGTVAAADSAKEATAFCKDLRQKGILDLQGITFGACVNDYKGAASDSATNAVSARCSEETIQEIFEVKNRGQCIKYVHDESQHSPGPIDYSD